MAYFLIVAAFLVIVAFLFVGGIYGAQKDPFDVMENIAPDDEKLSETEQILTYLENLPDDEVIGRCKTCGPEDSETCKSCFKLNVNIKNVTDKF